MPNNLKGRVAVVTGSGQGVGRTIAIALAQEGAKVVTNNRKPGSTSPFIHGEEFEKSLTVKQRERISKRDTEKRGDAATVASEIRDMGGEAEPFFGDVSDYEVVGQLIQMTVDYFGKIDILVNNAGTFAHVSVWEMTKEQWHHVTDNKPTSAFNTIRHAAPLMMKQKWGRILNCTSGAWLGCLNACNYASANAGVVGLTRAVAKELLPYGITCNAYAPQAITRSSYAAVFLNEQLEKLGRPLWPKKQQEDRLRTMDTSPGPEYLAPMVAFLATEAAANISGTVFRVSSDGSVFGRYSEPVVVKEMSKPEGLWTVDEIIKAAPKGLLEGYVNLTDRDPWWK
jgi:3-oxoacyl-[acyl-carrier protein] reductase